METIPDRAGSAAPRPWRYTAIGSVLLSWDALGIPAGLVVALPVLFYPSAVENDLGAILLGVAGFGAGVAALVLTALSVLLTTITPAYRRMLAKTPHGVAGATAPFQWVIAEAALAVVTGLGSAIAISTLLPGWPQYVAVAVPSALLLWSVLGCWQASHQLIQHWTRGIRAQDAEDTIAARSKGPRLGREEAKDGRL